MIQHSNNSLPELSEEHLLTKEQVSSYQEKGHILVKNLASADEVSAYRKVINEAVSKFKANLKPLEERESTYSKAFIQVLNLWVRDEAVRKFVMARRFAKAAAELLGAKAVRVYHDQALFKEAGGGHTPWHQDQKNWPIEGDMLTMWMPLVDIPAEMGSMSFVNGSQKIGYINKMTISDESHEFFKGYIRKKGLEGEQFTYGAMKAGDATFHNGWTFHYAPSNPTKLTREVMTVIYFADGARLVKPDWRVREDAFKKLFPGMQPGDLAAGNLTPLVYPV